MSTDNSSLRQYKQTQRQVKQLKLIFEERSDEDSSDDEPIINRCKKKKYTKNQSSTIKRILPQKRKCNNSISNSYKKRKINNCKRTEHSPLKRLKSKSVYHKSLAKPMAKIIKKIKRNEPIVIDLLSDSDDNNDNNSNNKNMICFAHNKCNKSVSIFNIPLNIYEHKLVENIQQQYNITVVKCDPFEIDLNNKSFKKCNQFELVNIEQRNKILKISKQNQLKISSKITAIEMSIPPVPKTCPIYFKKDINMDINKNTNTLDCHMDINAIKWMNKFPIFGLMDKITPLISAHEMINVPSFDNENDLYIDNENEQKDEQKDKHKHDEIITSISHNSHSVISSLTNICGFNTESIENEGWNFYLCIEKGMNNIIPMINVVVNKTQLKLHEKCDKMIWFQRKNEITTKYCEWIQNDVFDPMFSECIDLKFIAPHIDRDRKELISFRKELNKHNPSFLNPSIFDSEYYIGLKVLAVIEHMFGGTIIKAKVMKITIPTSINTISDTAFSPFVQSIPSTDTCTTINLI